MQQPAEISSTSSGDAVRALQRAVAQLPQVELPTTHYFAPGLYARKVTRPKGVVIVGKVHKREHLYIVCSGCVAVDGGAGARLHRAGDVIVSKPGTKRAVYAVEDSVCITVHRTDLTDLSEIEAELLEADDTALFDEQNRLILDVPKFRELTRRVIAAERPGFWSDWTEEQRALYTAGDWIAFSRSRGYTEEQIADYAAWLDMLQRAQACGANPYHHIADLAGAAALANAASDTRGEIERSSHLPMTPRNVQ